MRLPVSFDLNDPRQKAAYDILKNAGYGKRTPIIVDALLSSLKDTPERSGSEQSLSTTELRSVVVDAVETALRKYQLSNTAVPAHEPQVPTQDIVVKKSSRTHKSEPPPLPRQPRPLERTVAKQTSGLDESTTSDGNMDMLLSMADAFY